MPEYALIPKSYSLTFCSFNPYLLFNFLIIYSRAVKSSKKEWKIDTILFGAITDNGSNIVKAIVGHLNLVQIPCIGYILQLSIKRAFDLPAVQKVVGRCKKCITHFCKSTKETYKLHRNFSSYLNMN